MTQAAEDVEVTADEKVVEFEDKIAGMTVEELEKLKAFIEKAEESIKSGE